jgi:hypothetical protein
MEQYIIDKMNEDVSFIINDLNRANINQSFGDWEDRSSVELQKILHPDGSISLSKLERFIGDGIYVSDSPLAKIKGFPLKNNWFGQFIIKVLMMFGSIRVGVKEALLTFHILDKQGMLPMLKKYPVPDTGHPMKINYKNYTFTKRHLRYIFLISIFKKYLKNKLSDFPIVMDIGSSYGSFQRLIKKEIPGSHNILVDIPGQLIIAYYYLRVEFPDSKIAGIKEVSQAIEIDTNWIKDYDFILIPAEMYSKLVTKDIDVVTNFVSLAEMTKFWFETYRDSKPFVSAKYFFTVNRYDSAPTYSNDITIFDYHICDNKYKKILFQTLPILKSYFLPCYLFFTKKIRYPSELFIFIGENHK